MVFVSRYAALRSALSHVLDVFPSVECVGVESPPFGEQFSEGLYALFVYVNEAIYLARKNVVYFDPQTMKRLTKMDPTVRKGTMDKSDMIDAARSDTDIKRWNHNEADAYLVARSASHFWELESGVISRDDLTPAEINAFHRVHTYSKGEKAGTTKHSGLLFRENQRYFKFSQIPPDPEEEEFRQWLCQKGSKVMGLHL